MNCTSEAVTIVPSTVEDDADVVALAQRFNLSWTPAHDHTALQQYRYHLLIRNRRAELVSANTLFSPIKLSFVAGRNTHRRQFGGGKQQLIARAVGIGKKTDLRILDVTAGFGTDAFALASLGCEITLVERVPVLAAMLELAVQEAKQHTATESIANRMHVLYGDAIGLLQEPGFSAHFDTIYLDPMYPKSNKSALVKKNMQVLHDLVGTDESGDALLQTALNSAVSRAVVKRPRGAPALSNAKPSFEMRSAKTRFDIYSINP